LLIEFNIFDLPNGFVGFSSLDELYPIPPSTDTNYEYSPAPLKPLPPMSEQPFLHYMKYGDADNAHDQPRWFRRLPVRLKSKLVQSPEMPVWGWGIYVMEGPNWSVISYIVMATVSASILGTVLWSALKADIQGGTGLGNLIVALPPVIMMAFLFRLTVV
jgi:hypothetical protein